MAKVVLLDVIPVACHLPDSTTVVDFVAGYFGEMERTLSETGVMRQLWNYLHLDKIRRAMVNRANQRQKYASDPFLVVT